jgi:hypothetical protein
LDIPTPSPKTPFRAWQRATTDVVTLKQEEPSYTATFREESLAASTGSGMAMVEPEE